MSRVLRLEYSRRWALRGSSVDERSRQSPTGTTRVEDDDVLLIRPTVAGRTKITLCLTHTE